MAFDFAQRLGSMLGQRLAERVFKPHEQPAEQPAAEPEAPPATDTVAEAPPAADTTTEAPAADTYTAPPVTETTPEPAPAEAYQAPAEAPAADASAYSPAPDVSSTAPEPVAASPATDTYAAATPEAASAPTAEAPAAPSEPAKSAEEIEEERLWSETDAAWAAGDFQKVTELLDALKALQPEDAAVIDEKIAAAQYNQASEFEQAGQLDRALYLYQEAQRRNPNLGEAGFAIERVQAALNPPAPAEETAPAPPAEQTYTVQDGDSLWAIAERFYGDGSQYPRIFDANRDQLDNPDLIQPGQVLRVPA